MKKYRCNQTFYASINRTIKIGDVIDEFLYESLYNKEKSNFNPLK